MERYLTRSWNDGRAGELVQRRLWDGVHKRAAATRNLQVRMCVLASSSGGNCTVLVVGEGVERRLVLLDAGLSPRRTRGVLRELELEGVPIAAVVLTHLDSDHCCRTWPKYLGGETVVHLHERHLARLRWEGLQFAEVRTFEREFEPVSGVRVEAVMVPHDSLGTCAFRVTVEGTGRSLGFATDVGRVERGLIEHLRGVDVLAIESNYCPVLLENSGRPRALKERVSGGRGHLSNQQSARAVEAMEPGERVVLLHLSTECNCPSVALAEHQSWAERVTLSSRRERTPWIVVSE